MKKFTLAIILSSLICGHTFADDVGPVCHKCEKIREYNAEHPENNYYWYDDFLKEKKEDTTPKSNEEKEKDKK